MAELSGRQAEILQFINRHTDEHGYPPTVREIGEAVGLASPSTVHAHLSKLTEAGYLRRDPTKPRAILVHEDETGRRMPPRSLPRPNALPLVGSVAAGMPRLAEEHVEDWVQAPFQADFMLRVSGDSMRDAGILNGDLVAVRRQATADQRQIVVALVDEEATVKRFIRKSDHVVLMPENPDFPPIEVTDVTILGRVVGVLRDL
ncbi:MAG: transcriptional repressor LexA [Thermoleophilia bacterium]